MKKLLLALLFFAFKPSYCQDSLTIRRIDSLTNTINTFYNTYNLSVCGSILNSNRNVTGGFAEEYVSDSVNKTLLKVIRSEEWDDYHKDITYYFHKQQLIKVDAALYKNRKLLAEGSFYYAEDKNIYDRITSHTKKYVHLGNSVFSKQAASYIDSYYKEVMPLKN